MTKFKHLRWNIIGRKPERLPSKEVSTFLSFSKAPLRFHLYHTNYTSLHILSIPGHLEMYLDIELLHTPNSQRWSSQVI